MDNAKEIKNFIYRELESKRGEIEFSICPITPLCPMPEMFKDSWKDGYHRAFLAGRKKAMKE